MKIVTGATGLIGSHMVYYLVKKDYKVKALYHTDNKKIAIEKYFNYLDNHFNHSNIEWIKTDILDYEHLEEIFQDVKAVFHTAAMVSFRPKDRKMMQEINVQGTANVVNACLANHVDYLAHVSSVAALSNSLKNGKITEDFSNEEAENELYYGKTKKESEQEVFRGVAEGLTAAMINPVIVLGYSPFEDSSAALFHRINKGLSVYSPGSTGFVSVWDVVNILFQLYENKVNNQRFLISAQHLAYKDLFTQIANGLNKKAPSLKVPYPIALSFAYLSEKLKPKTTQLNVESIKSAYKHVKYDNTKLINTLNYKFQDISEIIKETVETMKNLENVPR